MPTPTVRSELPVQKWPLEYAALSSDARFVLTSSKDNNTQICDAGRRKATAITLRGHKTYVCAAAFSANLDYVVTGADDGELGFWYFDRPRASMLKTGETWLAARYRTGSQAVRESMAVRYVAGGRDDKASEET